ncbi:cyclin [Martiniozyma asiatica (nom. inval.)]|nr:cyclin [Martiniozyma asiatica]
MSDLEALYLFLNKPVAQEMVDFLASTTRSIIRVPVPADKAATTSLHHFIKRLISHSHVQTPTLMTTLIYLDRLRAVIPPNSIGMASTHHRIFLGSLLLAAKYTNDSSPMNKHWTKYTDGLLNLKEVNALEMEMISYIGWDNLRFGNDDLIRVFSCFLEPIKRKLRQKAEEAIQERYAEYLTPKSILSDIENEEEAEEEELISASPSMPSLVSSSSVSTMASYRTPSTSTTSLNVLANCDLNIPLKPLRLAKEKNQLNDIPEIAQTIAC